MKIRVYAKLIPKIKKKKNVLKNISDIQNCPCEPEKGFKPQGTHCTANRKTSGNHVR